MSSKSKLLALILVLLVACSVLFVSCDGGPGSGVDSSSEEEVSTEAPPDPNRELTLLTVDENGEKKANFRVVRSDALNSSSIIVDVAKQIRTDLSEKLGVSVDIGNDFVKDESLRDHESIEILVGPTEYYETDQVADTVDYGSYKITTVGNKIIVFGYTNAAIKKAGDLFVTTLTNKLVEAEDGTVTIKASDIEKDRVVDKVLSEITVFEGGEQIQYYDPGDDCKEIIISDTTVEQYDAYLQKLEADGYTCYTTNTISECKFATYNNSDYTINVGFYDHYDQVRIIIEDLAPAVGLESDNKYEQVTTPLLTSLGVAQGSSNNGICTVIRLSDGRFIIVDGGFNNSNNANALIDLLRDQASAYTTKDKDITIAAWIFTHAHGDHTGLIAGQYNAFKRFTVERVLYNFMSEAERAVAHNAAPKDFGVNEGTQNVTAIKASEELGATQHVVHVGQKFFLADAVIEILYTIESYGPRVVNALNTTSLVCKINIAGTTYMCTGDATGHGLEICTKMFGDYMKSDIAQVTHHGYTTWGNDTGVANAYKKMAPYVVMWPQGLAAYPNYVDKSYNKPIWDTKYNRNYLITFVAGSLGDRVEISLPINFTDATTAEDVKKVTNVTNPQSIKIQVGE